MVGSQFTILDNIECIGIAHEIGIDPGRAQFRYRFTNLDPNAPQSIEEALDSTYSFAKTVEIGDELVVTATKPGGAEEFIFDGHPLIFGMNLDRETENVHIIAVGIAKTAWDTPIAGQIIRDASNVDTGKDTQTDVLAQFNPKGRSNATKSEAWRNASGNATDNKYPTFIDPDVFRTPDVRDKWTLATIARYLTYRYFELVPTTTIKFPTGDVLDALLVSREPINGIAFDPANAATYTAKPIIVDDRPLTGRDWPSTINDFIRDKGFGMTWKLTTSTDTQPVPITTWTPSLLQLGAIKHVYLQPEGQWLDPEKSNLNKANIDRDLNNVINAWTVSGALQQYESSYVLAPGFEMISADSESIESIAVFDKSNVDFAKNNNNDKYRLFIFDETGEGHYKNGTNTPIDTATGLDPILGDPDNNGNPTHATRRRRPLGDMISTDEDGKTLRYTVAVSTDYNGTYPEIWDKTGTWQTVQGGVKLLKDRLGILITSDNPNEWKIGKSEDDTAPFPWGIVSLVESLSTPGGDSGNIPIFLRLDCVIEGDSTASYTAAPTTTSPLTETITRITDARDRYKKQTIKTSSFYNTTNVDVIARDDTDEAKAEAVANQVATQAGILDGSIVIPRFTRYYEIGDKIESIYGRNLSMRTDNNTTSNNNTAIYPIITGIEHVLQGSQMTILKISDQDGHRHRAERHTRGH